MHMCGVFMAVVLGYIGICSAVRVFLSCVDAGGVGVYWYLHSGDIICSGVGGDSGCEGDSLAYLLR